MKTIKTEIKWAAIFIGVFLLWMVLERLTALHDEHIDKHAYVTMFFFFIAILVYVLALRDKRDRDYNGVMTYKQGFISGLWITLIVSLCSPLTQWIISYVITPDYFNNVIQYAVETGYYESMAEAEAQFNYKTYAIQSTISAFVMGLITTAVVALFVKRGSAA